VKKREDQRDSRRKKEEERKRRLEEVGMIFIFIFIGKDIKCSRANSRRNECGALEIRFSD
jgi:hypothetical protein